MIKFREAVLDLPVLLWSLWMHIFLSVFRCFRRVEANTPWSTTNTSPACQPHKNNSFTNTWRPQASCLQRTSGRAEPPTELFVFGRHPHTSSPRPSSTKPRLRGRQNLRHFTFLYCFKSPLYVTLLSKHIYCLIFAPF